MPRRDAASDNQPAGAHALKPYAITVDFRLRPDSVGKFLELVRENAFLSVRDEPLCTRFDVLVPRDPQRLHSITLYEIYADRSAFDHHLSTAHFLEFDRATRDMVLMKTVLEFDADENAKPAKP